MHIYIEEFVVTKSDLRQFLDRLNWATDLTLGPVRCQTRYRPQRPKAKASVNENYFEPLEETLNQAETTENICGFTYLFLYSI